MKNILVIDINEFMPFITELFDVDYYSNLNINTEKTYDWVFISFPIEDTFLYSKFGFTSIQNETKWKIELNGIYNVLQNIKFNKLAIFDPGDCPHYDMNWFDKNGYQYDKIFKVEYRKLAEHEYDERVCSFPYMLFGKPCATQFLLQNYKFTHEPILNQCYWGFGAMGIEEEADLEYLKHNRPTIFNQIKEDLVIESNRMSFSDFTLKLSKHKFFCILNGCGKVHRRLWEGLAFNCIPLIQKNDIIYPDNMYKPNDYLYFNTADEFREKLNRLKTDKYLYETLLEEQKETIITKQSLREYINKNL